jgi:hypothetical protein
MQNAAIITYSYLETIPEEGAEVNDFRDAEKKVINCFLHKTATNNYTVDIVYW